MSCKRWFKSSRKCGLKCPKCNSRRFMTKDGYLKLANKNG